jgi:signal transduction histidine kinase
LYARTDLPGARRAAARRTGPEAASAMPDLLAALPGIALAAAAMAVLALAVAATRRSRAVPAWPVAAYLLAVAVAGLTDLVPGVVATAGAASQAAHALASVAFVLAVRSLLATRAHAPLFDRALRAIAFLAGAATALAATGLPAPVLDAAGVAGAGVIALGLAPLAAHRLPGAAALLAAIAAGGLAAAPGIGWLPVAGAAATATAAVGAVLHVALVGVALLERIRSDDEELSATAGARHARALREVTSRLELALEDETRARNNLARFIDIITHEYRNPVMTIQSSLDVLASVLGAGNDRVDRLVARIRRGIANLTRTMESGLEERIGMASSGVLLEDVAIGRLLEDIAAECRTTWPGVSIALKGDSGAGNDGGKAAGSGTTGADRIMRTDPFAVRTILVNVISNAAKYGRGTPVSVTWRVDAGGGIVVTVEDGGPGVPARELDRILDRGYRAAGTDETIAGTGNGLYIVRHLLGLLGGDIRFSSPPGAGLCVVLLIPDARRADTPPHGPEA